jgi:RND family efflux transporter MFP subunit
LPKTTDSSELNLNGDDLKTDDASNGHVLGAHRAPGSARISTQYAAGTGRLLAFATGALAILLIAGFIVAMFVRHHFESLAAQRVTEATGSKEAVDVVEVRATSNSYPLTLPGQTAGWYQSTIFARVDGYIDTWTANIGDRVKQGQVLATIDTPELDQELKAARAKAAASEAQVHVAESTVSITKLTFDRWRESPKGVVSEQEREEKKAGYEEAVARLAAAQAQTQLDQAEVSRYSAMEEFKKVTAPYDGVITARHVDIGNLVTAGSSTSMTSLYSIAQSNVVRVFVNVPQKAAAEIFPDLPAHAASDQFAGRRFEGKVARTAMSIDPQTRTQQTEVDIPNPDLALVPGMYVEVTFELKQGGMLEVPAAAMLFRPAGLQVAVVTEAGKVEFRNVTIAQDNGDEVELGSGVKQGERVAVNLSSAIEAGQEVDVVDANRDFSSPKASK